MILAADVTTEICRHLRCCVPHHVQQFFDYLHQHLRRNGSTTATIEDVALVYERELLSVRGQIDLEHYEVRLRMVLGDVGYGTALELLTEAAVNEGELTPQGHTGVTAMRLRRQMLMAEFHLKTCSTRWNTTGICSAGSRRL